MKNQFGQNYNMVRLFASLQTECAGACNGRDLPMGRGRTGRRKKGAGSCVPTGSDAFDVKKYEKGTSGKNREKIFAGND